MVINTILGLDSEYEQKHEMFGFLSLAYLTQHDDLQFYQLLTNDRISS
jgi:hypothetical protein